MKVLKDQALLIFCILVPLLYPVLYAFVYTRETVREVPTVAVAPHDTPDARRLMRQLDATPDLRLVCVAPNLAAARDSATRLDAYGIVKVPESFGAGTDGQAKIECWTDLQGMLYYKAVLSACTNVSLAAASDAQYAGASPSATAKRQAEAGSPGVGGAARYEEINLFNPSAGFSAFLIPAVLILVLQQTLVLGLGILCGSRRDRFASDYRRNLEEGRLHGIRFKDLGTEWHNLVIRTSLQGIYTNLKDRGALFFLYFVIAAYVLLVVPWMFDMPQVGIVWELAPLVILFLMAVQAFGHFVTLFCSQRETVIMLVVWASVPLLFLSGISWPRAAMPELWQWVATLFPSTYGIRGFVAMNTMGADLLTVRPELLALAVQTLAYSVLYLIGKQIAIRRIEKRHTAAAA